MAASSSFLFRPSSSLLVAININHSYTAPSSSAMSMSASTTPPAPSSSASVAAASPKTHHVRIVSYNLLSSKLASPSHFTHTDPERLRPEYRLPLILSKLEQEMTRSFGDGIGSTSTIDGANTSDGAVVGDGDGDRDGTLDKVPSTMTASASAATPPPTIFALQEVCYPFASALHAFFASRGYHFVTGLYGKPFNGYVYCLSTGVFG